MEETVDAVAVAIGYLGEAALERNADRLVDLASAIPFSVSGNDARNKLIVAAAALSQARSDAAKRSEAVALLGEAASALAPALSRHAEDLRVAAADLARACRDYRAATYAQERTHCAPAPRMEERRPRPWWSLLRWCRRAPAEDNENQLGQALMDPAHEVIKTSAIISAEYLAMEVTPGHLVEKANNVTHAAAEAAVDHDELEGYIHTLTQNLENGIIELIVKAATKLEQLASSEVISLQRPAVSLVCACQEYQKVSNAMLVVQNAAAKQALQREQAQGRWWRICWRRRLGGLEQGGAPSGHLPSAQALDRISDMRAGALFGSLAMVPYLGPEGVLKTFDFDQDYRRVVCKSFYCCWGLVGLGMSCSPARSHFLHHYAQLSSRLGMLGITIFVIFFCQWLLDPTGDTPWWYILAAVFLHLFVFLWSRIEGDM